MSPKRRQDDTLRAPAERTIAVAIVNPTVAGARVEVQVDADPNLWLRGTTDADGYVSWQWPDSLGDSALEIAATGYAPYLQSVHWKTLTDPDVGPPPLNHQVTVGGDLPPLVSLVPPPPDVTPADEEGPIAITWPTMSDPGGPWRWKGFSDFLLFWRYLNGEDIGPLLADRISVGATVLRVFGMVAWDDISPRYYPQDYGPAYYTKLSAFVALLAAHRLRLEFTIFCDCRDAPQVMPNAADRDRHQQQVIEALKDAGPMMTDGGYGETWNVFVEVANEPFKNLPGGNEEAVARAEQLVGQGFLVAAGNYDARSSTVWQPWPPGDYGTTHAARSDDWPRKCKDIYDLAQDGDIPPEPRVPWIGDEPMGAAEANDPGRRSNIPADFGWYFAGAAMFGPGGTFHCDAGTHSDLLGPNQRTCALAAFAALDWVPTDAPYWPYQRGGMNEDGTPSDTGIGNMPILHDDNLELRSYCKGNGSQSWCIQIRTSRAHATARDGWRIVSEPRPGFVYLEKP